MQGLLLFYKPIDWRNKNILYFFQKTFGKDIKVGHSGTLDPFAEGLMVMGLGRKFTKQLHDLLLNTKKEYVAKIELGKTSDTYDLTGKITKTQTEHKPTKEAIVGIIEKEFLGEKIQTPPIYSAKKHNGKRLRDLAVKNHSNILENVGMIPIEEIAKSKSKNVTLYDFEIISYQYPYLEIKLLVSSGYYIRSFGNDLGEKLNVGAYLTGLKRTKLGEFSVENALLPADFPASHSELHEESHSPSSARTNHSDGLRGTTACRLSFSEWRKQSRPLSFRPPAGGLIRNLYSKSAKSKKTVELHGEIFGNVQGVGFRYFTKELADKLTISGYSKNTENNSVKFLAQGNLNSIGKFQTEILQPPTPIEISDYQFTIQKPSQIYKDFEIL